MYTDPIADLLTRIRNASRANLNSCNIPHSKLKENLLKILLEKGFIEKFETVTPGKFPELQVTLIENQVLNIDRVSSPGQRIYLKKDNMKAYVSGRGIRVVSTSKGLMTSEEAKKQKLGGEVICQVY